MKIFIIDNIYFIYIKNIYIYKIDILDRKEIEINKN